MNSLATFSQTLEPLNFGVLETLLVLSFVYLVFGLDDFFIDFVAAVRRLKPQRLSQSDLDQLEELPEKHIAIIVPAWHEGNIIDRMLAGNAARIEYANYHFFVGVYPNDHATVDAVREVSKTLPNVHAVVNYKDGPTSKGQILNYVLKQILDYEKKAGFQFSAFHMQDAEDLIHPKVLKLVNERLDRYDFIQVPVFSLEVKAKQFVAGTYVDEFAESHTKDILVREALGAAIPSAGVGTTLARRLVLAMMRQNDGWVFNEGSVTEDYELGVRAHAAGFKPHVACTYYQDAETGRSEYIATREYFPKMFSRSVRQKTRWTVGIALQGYRNLGWVGGLANRYFLLRDRKGILANAATFVGYPTLLLASAYAAFIDSAPATEIFASPGMQALLAINASLMCLRLIQRMRCVARVYGVHAALPVVLRWPLGNAVNALAAFRAVKQDVAARFNKATIAWAKTDHELPDFFGQPAGKLRVAK